MLEASLCANGAPWADIGRHGLNVKAGQSLFLASEAGRRLLPPGCLAALRARRPLGHPLHRRELGAGETRQSICQRSVPVLGGVLVSQGGIGLLCPARCSNSAVFAPVAADQVSSEWRRGCRCGSRRSEAALARSQIRSSVRGVIGRPFWRGKSHAPGSRPTRWVRWSFMAGKTLAGIATVRTPADHAAWI
jgi:hypothetical protein